MGRFSLEGMRKLLGLLTLAGGMIFCAYGLGHLQGKEQLQEAQATYGEFRRQAGNESAQIKALARTNEDTLNLLWVRRHLTDALALLETKEQTEAIRELEKAGRCLERVELSPETADASYLPRLGHSLTLEARPVAGKDSLEARRQRIRSLVRELDERFLNGRENPTAPASPVSLR